jgi:hypothetical protein
MTNHTSRAWMPLRATSELSVLAIACVRVAQRPPLCRRLGGEGITTQAVEVRVPERGQPGDSLVGHGLAAAAQALDDGVEVTGIRQHDGVADQAEGGELNFLAFAIGLPDLAAVAVADLAAEAMAGFLPGELPAHPPLVAAVNGTTQARTWLVTSDPATRSMPGHWVAILATLTVLRAIGSSGEGNKRPRSPIERRGAVSERKGPASYLGVMSIALIAGRGSR